MDRELPTFSWLTKTSLLHLDTLVHHRCSNSFFKCSGAQDFNNKWPEQRARLESSSLSEKLFSPQQNALIFLQKREILPQPLLQHSRVPGEEPAEEAPCPRRCTGGRAWPPSTGIAAPTKCHLLKCVQYAYNSWKEQKHEPLGTGKVEEGII